MPHPFFSVMLLWTCCWAGPLQAAQRQAAAPPEQDAAQEAQRTAEEALMRRNAIRNSLKLPLNDENAPSRQLSDAQKAELRRQTRNHFPDFEK